MAGQRETAEQALARWRDLETLQEHYELFDDFLVDVIENVMGFQCTEVQSDIGDWVAHGPQYRMVQAQRGQAKTTITACYAVWRLIHDPTTRVLIISAGEDQATEIANWIIQIINNMDVLECMRPDRSCGDRASVSAYDIHYSLKGPEKSPSVACIGITANMQGKRADLLIADDIESKKNSQTQVMRTRLHELTLDFTSICSNGDIIYLGTPQHIDSEYNTLPGRGYAIRIWPGRFPTPQEAKEYDGRLAPSILAKLEENPSLATGGGPTGTRGQPVDPVLLNEEALIKKEIDQGAAYFQLQHMLSTHMSDAARFPLKVGKIKFLRLDIGEKRAPMTMDFLPIKEHQITTPEGYYIKDKMYRIQKGEDFGAVQGWHMYVDPSGGGKNGDELAYAVSGFCAGRVILVDAGGIPGGIEDFQLNFIRDKIYQWQPYQVDIEKNFGNGAFASVLRTRIKPDKMGGKSVGIEDVWESGQKELRIIDIMEPVLGSGKFCVDEDLIQSDFDQCLNYPAEHRSTYCLFWQMSRITRDKKSLMHDDRLDAVAGTVRHWVELLAIDDEKAKIAAANEQYRKMMQNPLGNGRPVPGWNNHIRIPNTPNILTRHGLATVNHLRRI